MDAQLLIEICILCVVLLIARVLYLIHKITTGHSKYASTKRERPCRTIICIGSGGHTTEMITLIKNLDFTHYSPRYYVMAKSDVTSEAKVEELERNKAMMGHATNFVIYKIPRSRAVHQSFLTSVFTTIFSIIYSVPIVLKANPELILCNGPGTCIPICGLGFLLKILFITDTKIVFVESFCRTRSLSLSGKILLYLADNFLVQWPGLKEKFKRTDYIGQLM